MTDILLYIPWPPSDNHYYVQTRNGKFISKKGREFRQAVLSAVQEQLPGVVLEQPLYVEASMFPPDNRIRDIGNYVKAMNDAITQTGLWLDDRQVDQLFLKRGMKVDGGAIKMEITDAGPVIPWDG